MLRMDRLRRGTRCCRFYGVPVSNDRSSALTYDQYLLVKTVAEDLAHLASSWTTDLTTERARRESGILRRLLVDRDYAKAWTVAQLPRTPLVRAPDLDTALAGVKRGHVAFSMAPSLPGVNEIKGETSYLMRNPPWIKGGDLLVVIPPTHRNFILNMVIPHSEVASISDHEAYIRDITAKLNPEASRTYWLNKYLESAAAVVDRGTVVSRQDIIKYAANRLGGVHYGKSDKVMSKRIQELLDPQYARLDDTPVVFLELTNICRAIVDSTDAFRLRHAFSKMPPPPSPLDEPKS